MEDRTRPLLVERAQLEKLLEKLGDVIRELNTVYRHLHHTLSYAPRADGRSTTRKDPPE